MPFEDIKPGMLCRVTISFTVHKTVNHDDFNIPQKEILMLIDNKKFHGRHYSTFRFLYRGRVIYREGPLQEWIEPI